MKAFTLIISTAFSFLCCSFSSSNSLESKSIESSVNVSSQAIPNHAIVFQLSSPHHYIDGCEYWVTLTVAYIFDDFGNYLGPQVSSPTLNYNCGSEGPYSALVSMSITTGSGYLVNSVSFSPTNDTQHDSFLSDPQTLKDIEELINDNIPRP